MAYIPIGKRHHKTYDKWYNGKYCIKQQSWNSKKKWISSILTLIPHFYKPPFYEKHK